MPGQSISEAMFLPAFKAAAAEGAAVELKMRLLAGKIPALQKHVHRIVLEDIEAGLIEHFGAALSGEDKETLRLCRQLRNCACAASLGTRYSTAISVQRGIS